MAPDIPLFHFNNLIKPGTVKWQWRWPHATIHKLYLFMIFFFWLKCVDAVFHRKKVSVRKGVHFSFQQKKTIDKYTVSSIWMSHDDCQLFALWIEPFNKIQNDSLLFIRHARAYSMQKRAVCLNKKAIQVQHDNTYIYSICSINVCHFNQIHNRYRTNHKHTIVETETSKQLRLFKTRKSIFQINWLVCLSSIILNQILCQCQSKYIITF